MLLTLILGLACGGCGEDKSVVPEETVNTVLPTPSHRQIVLVQSETWESSQGQLKRLEWNGKSGWKQVGQTIDVYLGTNGMAWGTGLYSWKKEENDPQKIEGDSRSPAGIFALLSTFGPVNKKMVTWNIPYQSSNPNILCIRDTGSQYYNTIINQLKIPKRDWHDFDQLRREDNLYKWGIVIAHNPTNHPPDGSCMFLHSQPARETTTGGTGMPERMIVDIIPWLDIDAKPILIQSPKQSLSVLSPVLKENGIELPLP